MNFLVRYLGLAVVASVAVYGLAPLLADGGKPRGTPRRAPCARPVSAGTPPAPAGEIPLVPAGPVERAPSRAADKPSGAAEAPPVPAGAPPPAAAPAADEGPGGAAVAARGRTPSTEAIRPSGPDVEYWGVTLDETALFEQDGRRREDKLAGGSLVEQVGSVKSSRGEMAKVRVWDGAAWAGPYLVSAAGLVRFEGGREEIDAEGVADLRRYYALSSRLERRKAELKRLAAGKNPYFAELKSVATTFNANVEKARRMTRERDQAKGPGRARIADELRALQIANQKNEVKVKALTKKYEAWKAAHGAEAVSLEDDPQIRSTGAEMAEIRPRLARFGL